MISTACCSANLPASIRGLFTTALSWALLAVAAAMLPGRGAAQSIRPPEAVIASWPNHTAHVLVGKIWLAGERRLADGVQLSRGLLIGTPIADTLGLRRQTYVLLGEVHDNAEHHLLRAGLIDSLTQPTAFGRNAFPAVVSEHINVSQLPALAQFNALASSPAGPPPGPADLFRLLAWDRSGWPAARMFEPLYGAVIEARLALRAGDVPRERIRALARGGVAALEQTEATRLALDRALATPLAAALDGEIKASHCGMLPDSAIAGMAFAQRYRDAHLAMAMIDARRDFGRAILLAGNGHVRNDRGVPWYLRARDPGADIFTLLLIEVEDGITDAQTYLPRSPDGKPAADAVIFTPRAAREDPCARMRQHMQQSGKKE